MSEILDSFGVRIVNLGDLLAYVEEFRMALRNRFRDLEYVMV